MDKIACCFTGHRVLLQEDVPGVRENLTQAVEHLIANGVSVFITGGAKGFDALAAEVIVSRKRRCPQLSLWLALPYFKKSDDQYTIQADRVEILSPRYYRGCMHARNRFMVEHAAYCVCYLRKESGGTAYTVNYAKQRGLNIIYI